MHQIPRRKHVNRALFAPFRQRCPVDAAVCRGVGGGGSAQRMPAVRYEADVTVTEGKFAEGAEAVF